MLTVRSAYRRLIHTVHHGGWGIDGGYIWGTRLPGSGRVADRENFPGNALF